MRLLLAALLSVGFGACVSLGPLTDGAGGVDSGGGGGLAESGIDDAAPGAVGDAASTVDGAVLDGAVLDGGDASAEASGPPPTSRVLYVAPVGSRTDFLSVASADARCLALKPSVVASAKAVLVATTRRACASINCINGGQGEHIDWPLLPSMTYTRADRSTVIGHTDDVGLFANTLVNAIGTDPNFAYVWTGLSINAGHTWTDWTTSSYTCSDWTDTSAGAYGYVGYALVAGAAFGAFIDPCNKSYSLYCAEL